MLNYIWAALIVLALLFALVSDFRDVRGDPYRNGQPLAVTLTLARPFDASAAKQEVSVHLDPQPYEALYGVKIAPQQFPGELRHSAGAWELRFASGKDLPAPLATIRTARDKEEKELRGVLIAPPAEGVITAGVAVRFEPVRFLKLKAITEAAFEFAKVAVTLALGLIGILALWQGLLQIADKAGLVNVLVKVVRPALRPLFPGIPEDSPALGLIALNLSANILGLGNAATPLGLKAMEELQRLNKGRETASDAMVMLLAINTSSVQLIPAPILFALMGVAAAPLLFPIIVVTFLTQAISIIAVKLLGRFKGYANPTEA